MAQPRICAFAVLEASRKSNVCVAAPGSRAPCRPPGFPCLRAASRSVPAGCLQRAYAATCSACPMQSLEVCSVVAAWGAYAGAPIVLCPMVRMTNSRITWRAVTQSDRPIDLYGPGYGIALRNAALPGGSRFPWCLPSCRLCIVATFQAPPGTFHCNILNASECK